MLPKELDILKRKTPETQKAYWMENTAPHPSRGGCPGKGHGEIVGPGAYRKAVFHPQLSDSQKTSDHHQKRLTSVLDRFSLQNGQ